MPKYVLKGLRTGGRGRGYPVASPPIPLSPCGWRKSKSATRPVAAFHVEHDGDSCGCISTRDVQHISTEIWRQELARATLSLWMAHSAPSPEKEERPMKSFKDETAKSLEDQMNGDDGVFDLLENTLRFYCESRGLDPDEYDWTLGILQRNQDEIDELKAGE